MSHSNELKEIYSKYSNEKLVNIINNSNDYETYVIDLVKDILNDRGGIDKIKNEFETKKQKEEEIKSIKSKISKLHSEGKSIEISNIHSDLLTDSEKKEIIESEMNLLAKVKKDNTITNKEYLACILFSFVISTILGIFFGYISSKIGYYYYIFLVASYLILNSLLSRIILRRTLFNLKLIFTNFAFLVYSLFLTFHLF
jgi:hypothetical protein